MPENTTPDSAQTLGGIEGGRHWGGWIREDANSTHGTETDAKNIPPKSYRAAITIAERGTENAHGLYELHP